MLNSELDSALSLGTTCRRGYTVMTLFFQAYPSMLASGGWPLLFQAYAALVVGSGVCVLAFFELESHYPKEMESPFAEKRIKSE